jgi:hypothetical protein
MVPMGLQRGELRVNSVPGGGILADPIALGLSAFSVTLGLVGVVLAVAIYRISEGTSARLFEDALNRALSQARPMGEDPGNPLSVLSYKRKQELRRKIERLLQDLRPTENGLETLHAIDLAITFRSDLRDTDFASLLDHWRARNLVTWVGPLESSSEIRIKDRNAIYESIASRKPRSR